MTKEHAQAELLAAYQQLERAQEQMQAMQAHLRNCELRKVQCEAVVQALTEKSSGE